MVGVGVKVYHVLFRLASEARSQAMENRQSQVMYVLCMHVCMCMYVFLLSMGMVKWCVPKFIELEAVMVDCIVNLR